MTSLSIPIPPGHVAKVKPTHKGCEVEFLRFFGSRDEALRDAAIRRKAAA
jgi:hypothetical protein